tara:strand:+ start:1677 stop:1862 length:186 start_codon:yes stop_codon:yes gene_type:complete
MTNQKQIRAAFWQGNEHFKHFVKSKKQNQYNATIRSEFVEFIDMLERDGHISQNLAQRATL